MKNLILVFLLGSGLVLGSYHSVSAVTAKGAIDLQRVVSEEGFAYYAMQDFGTPGDTTSAPTQSVLRIFENGIELGPAHTLHANIRNIGLGRFSHWGATSGSLGLYFSASDNSDPRTNGRTYTYLVSAQAPADTSPTSTSSSSPSPGRINTQNAAYDSGFAYIVNQNWGTPGDTGAAPTQSVLRIFENGIELGPAHTLHANIRNIGLGRFSHWDNNLWFSASDNTDPRTNGRTYTYSINSQTPAGITQAPPPDPTPPAPTPAPAPVPNTLKTDLAVYPEPLLPSMGPAGSTITDPTFGTKILRVTDGADGNQDCFIPYSYYPTFNSDSTRLYYQCQTPNNTAYLADFDPTTMTVSNRRRLTGTPGGLFAHNMKWSGSNPAVIYGHDYNSVWSYNVATDSWTLLKNLGAYAPAGGYLDQMSHSRDNDDVFAFSKGNSGGAHIGYLVWRRSTDTIVLNVDDAQADEVQVDPSGLWLNVQETTGNTIIRDLTTLGLVQLTGGVGYFHEDTASGYVFTADGGSGLSYRNLAIPYTFTSILPGYFGFSNMNYSMYADNTLWALVWVQRNDSDVASKPFEGELLQVATDGSNRVRRIAHHRSQWNDYDDQPNATISRDGRFVAFKSNWGNANGRRDVYIVEIPPAPAQ